LAFLMGNEEFKTKDGNLFSHFEVIKKDGTLICRNVKSIKEKIEISSQFKDLENNKSILLIRLSEFSNKTENNNEFNTLGVITIYLNDTKRLNEKKLRLLLALRQDLVSFIKKKISGTTFLELLSFEIEKNLVKNNSHYLQTFKTNLQAILESTSNHTNESKLKISFLDNLANYTNETKSKLSHKIIDKSELELNHSIILNAIFSQINMIDFDVAQKQIDISDSVLIKYISNILTSKYIAGGGFKKSNFEIQPLTRRTFKFFELQYDIIIPQLLINIKTYADNSNLDQPNIKIYEDGDYLTFYNLIGNRNDNKKRIRGGKAICKDITKRIFNIKEEDLHEYINFEESEIEFIVKLKI
jgi:hypothetical protein